MAYQFQLTGVLLSPSRVRVAFDVTSTTLVTCPLAILDPGEWTTYIYSGGFTTTGAPEIRQIVQPNTNKRELEFTFAARLDGLYKIKYTGSGDVDTDYDLFFFREDKATHEPYSLVIEGVGEIPYYYFNQRELPSGVSQRLNPKKPVTEDFTVELSLVDLTSDTYTDGYITSLLESWKNGPHTALDADIAATGSVSTITGVDFSDFDTNGLVYIDAEVFSYLGKTSTTLVSVTRAQKSSSEQAHTSGKTTVYSYNYYLRGRRAYLQDGSGTRIFSGVIDKFMPMAGNLAAYQIHIASVMSRLDAELGARFGRGQIARYFQLDPFEVTSLRITTDFTSNTRSRAEFISLVSGGYAISKVSNVHGDQTASDLYSGTLAYAIAKGIYDGTSYVPSVTIDDDLRIHISVSTELPNVYRATLRDFKNSGLLERLGVGGNEIELNVDSLTRFDDAIVSGISKRSQTINLMLESEYANSLQFAFGNSRLIKIDDEIIRYGSYRTTTDNLGTYTLNASVDIDDTKIEISDSGGGDRLAYGDIITVGSEDILLGSATNASATVTIYVDCVRGYNGTFISTHSSSASITVNPVANIGQCKRGYLGTEAAAHEGGAEMIELITNFVGTTDVKADPFAFLAGLIGYQSSALGGYSSVPDWALEINSDDVDSTAFEAVQDRTPGLINSFLIAADPDMTYREVFERLAQAMGIIIYTNTQGQISLKRIRPILLTEDSISNSVTHDDFVSFSIEIDEENMIRRIKAEIDYSYLDEETKGTYYINNLDQLSREFDIRDYQYSIKTEEFHGSGSRVQPGSYDTYLISRVALAVFDQYGQPLYLAKFEIHESRLSGVSVGDTFFLTDANAPDMDGGRGLSSEVFEIREIDRSYSDDTLKITAIRKSSKRYVGYNLSAEVSSVAGHPNSIEIKNTNFWTSGDNPNDYIATGDTLVFKNYSGATLSTVSGVVSGTVPSSWTAGKATISFSPPLGSSPSVGDFVVAGNYDDAAGGGNVYKLLAFIADTNGALGAANDDGHNWSY